MFVIDIGPIKDNPQTHYKLIFGKKVSIEKILSSLQNIAELRAKMGTTTDENTIETVKEAQEKLTDFFTHNI